MHKILFLCLLLLASACTPYVGLAVHAEYQDAPDHYAPNPLGVFGAEYRTNTWSTYCEHISSVQYKEKGAGWNTCGAKYYIQAP